MDWNGMDGPPVAFAVAVAVAPASHSRPPVGQSSASEDGTQTEESGVGLVRWILADEYNPDLSRIFSFGSNPTLSDLHPNIRKRGSTRLGRTLPFNQTHGYCFCSILFFSQLQTLLLRTQLPP